MSRSARLVLLILASSILLVAAQTKDEQAVREAARIGLLSGGRAFEEGSDRLATFKEALRRRGYMEGRDVMFDIHNLGLRADIDKEPLTRLRRTAEDLAATDARILVAGGSTEALTAMQVTRAIPIVFWSSDPSLKGSSSHSTTPARTRLESRGYASLCPSSQLPPAEPVA